MHRDSFSQGNYFQATVIILVCNYVFPYADGVQVVAMKSWNSSLFFFLMVAELQVANIPNSPTFGRWFPHWSKFVEISGCLVGHNKGAVGARNVASGMPAAGAMEVSSLSLGILVPSNWAAAIVQLSPHG